MRMQEVQITIEGLSPLLMNKFPDTDDQPKPVFRGEKPPRRDQAEAKLYVDEQGIIHVPGPNIFRGIIDAGTFHKAGKQKITTMKTSLVPAGMGIVELTCPVLTPEGQVPSWEVDSRSVVIPSTGGRIMCHRPRFDHWMIKFTLDVDLNIFDLALTRRLVDDFGLKIGLGDFRPAKKGLFGKFVVTHWAAEAKTKMAA
jgi:hypothetical protein